MNGGFFVLLYFLSSGIGIGGTSWLLVSWFLVRGFVLSLSFLLLLLARVQGLLLSLPPYAVPVCCFRDLVTQPAYASPIYLYPPTRP